MKDTMVAHWTYEDLPTEDCDLRQGDIIYPSEELLSVFNEVHQHFTDPKYLGFVVITHCCDLVRRGHRHCKADYISLAVVRDFETQLEKFLDKTCKSISKGVYSQKSKATARDLITRILNQNEHALGLFYLHPEMGAELIPDNAVALLRVTVSLRAKDHYETIQRARCRRLGSEFRSKLGWLVGNIYSRVGTPDWCDQKDGEKQLDILIDDFLNSEKYAWVDEASVKSAQSKGVNLSQLSRSEVLSELENHKPVPPKIQIASAASKLLEELLGKLPNAIASNCIKNVQKELQLSNVEYTQEQINTNLLQSLKSSYQVVIDEIASSVTKSILSNSCESSKPHDELAQRIQSLIRDSIKQQIDRLPKNLSSRMINDATVSRTLKQNDTF